MDNIGQSRDDELYMCQGGTPLWWGDSTFMSTRKLVVKKYRREIKRNTGNTSTQNRTHGYRNGMDVPDELHTYGLVPNRFSRCTSIVNTSCAPFFFKHVRRNWQFLVSPYHMSTSVNDCTTSCVIYSYQVINTEKPKKTDFFSAVRHSWSGKQRSDVKKAMNLWFLQAKDFGLRKSWSMERVLPVLPRARAFSVRDSPPQSSCGGE